MLRLRAAMFVVGLTSTGRFPRYTASWETAQYRCLSNDPVGLRYSLTRRWPTKVLWAIDSCSLKKAETAHDLVW